MAKTKTIHTPEGKSYTLTFAGAKMAEIKRVDPASATVKFHCNLGNGLSKLFDKMGWTQPGDKTTREDLEGKLMGGNFIFTSQDKLVDAEVDIAYTDCKGFACHRFELEGRKKKGFRRELRFTITFKEQDGVAKLESYMMTTDNAKGSLKVVYFPEAVQDEMDLSNDEARQAVLEGVEDE